MPHKVLLLLLHVAILGLPIATPVACVVACGRVGQYRRRGAPVRTALHVTAREMLAGSSVACILLLTLLPLGHRQATVSLVPFTDIRRTVTAGTHVAGFRADVAANVVLFVPFGIFVPLAIQALNSAKRIVLLAAGFSIAIETLQFFLPLSRTTSTDDVLLNTTGAVLGFLILRALRRSLPRDAQPLQSLNARTRRPSVGTAGSNSKGGHISHPF